MFDVFFISYNEQYADENFEALLDKAPLAKRVDGIKGIFNAHKHAAAHCHIRFCVHVCDLINSMLLFLSPTGNNFLQFSFEHVFALCPVQFGLCESCTS